MAPSLTNEQNKVIKELYKLGRKNVHFQSHVYFLNESLKLKFIPKSFRIKNNLPGNKSETQKQLDLVSFACIECERNAYEVKLVSIVVFEAFPKKRDQVFPSSMHLYVDYVIVSIW